MRKHLIIFLTLIFGFLLFATSLLAVSDEATTHRQLDQFQGTPPLHVKFKPDTSSPTGYSPAQVRTAYNLPLTGGTGTIAIIDAYGYSSASNDLNKFSAQFSLPVANFEKHMMANSLRNNSGWDLEQALDIEWAHAIAPNAKILLVEAKSASGTDLLNAVNYARNRSDVVAISMSWGGNEFSGESSYDGYFTSPYGASFFASSGDNGTGAQWPAVSPNITGVGGTTLPLNSSGNLTGPETAWSGSGGGLSAYEAEPTYQTTFGVLSTNGFRAVPDVSYDADPNTGVSVYDSISYNGQSGWFTVGGTSAGSPQWAAIKSLGGTAINSTLYPDATKSYTTYFRDIISGTNGTCGFYCTAQKGYDYVTGLGSPVTTNY